MNEPVVVEHKGERFSESGLCFADPTFFEVFDFTLQAGDPRAALTRPYSLVLSSTLARKYFGDHNPVGQTLKINGEHTYEVMGVLDPQAGRSHLQFGLLASFSTLTALDPGVETWAEGGANPYVLLAPNYSAEELEAHLDEHLDDYMGYLAGGIDTRLQRLTGIYFSDWPPTVAEKRGDVRYIYLFSTDTHVVITSHHVEGYEHEAGGVPWIATFDVDYDFLDLLNIKLRAGRDFDPAFSTDLDGAVLVNETAVRHFGWGSSEAALGKWVKSRNAWARTSIGILIASSG